MRPPTKRSCPRFAVFGRIGAEVANHGHRRLLRPAAVNGMQARPPSRLMNSRPSDPRPMRLRTGHRTNPHRNFGRGRQGANDVRFGSKADMCSAKGHVRSTPESGHVQCDRRNVRLVPIADINVANWVSSKCQIRKSRWWNGGPGFEKRRPTF